MHTRVKAAAVVLACALVWGSTASRADVPKPWKAQDIGDCGTAGTATLADGKLTVKASGGDIWDQADAFHFVYQPLKGDGTIVARVASLDNSNEWAKAGVMIREKLEADSPHAYMCTTPSNTCHLQSRPAKGEMSANTDENKGDAPPYWVKLVRKGDTMTGFISKDGKDWEKVGEVEVKMAPEVFIGVAVTSHDNGTTTNAVVDNLAVTTG